MFVGLSWDMRATRERSHTYIIRVKTIDCERMFFLVFQDPRVYGLTELTDLTPMKGGDKMFVGIS